MTYKRNQLPRIPQLALEPLNAKECALVLALLAANLSQRKQAKNIIKLIAEVELATPTSMEFQTSKKGRQPAWQSSALNDLLMAQEKWHATAHGPNGVNSDVQDFDEYQLENIRDFRIPPFTVINERPYQSRRLFHPVLRIHVRSIVDIFDWLSVRAVVNRQLSRFVHCVVCGTWVLKKRAGKRSVLVRQYDLKLKKPRKWQNVVAGFVDYLPSWPGVCSENSCRSKFAAVFPDHKRSWLPRSKFRVDEFHGMTPGQGNKLNMTTSAKHFS